MRTLVNRSLGDRWRKRDESIAAEFEAVLSERDEGSDVAAVGVHELGGGLIMWAPLLACYLSPRQTLARPPASLLPEMIQEDFLIGLSAFFRTPLIDRTGVLNQDQLWDCCLGLAVLDPLPKKDPSFCKDLATVCSCLKVIEAGPPSVPGIDSTSLLIALLQALHPHWSPLRESALEQGANELIVRCSADSIAEYPWFHENVLLKLAELGGICLEPLADSEEVTALWEGPASRLTVTGECGDQIFGSQLLEAAFVKSELRAIFELGLDAPWQDGLPELKEYWLAWFLPFVERCPLPVVTTFDLLWWLNVACKWQTVCLRLFQRRPSLSWSDLKRILHFFQTEEFQQWSFVPENHAAKMADHAIWSSYKQPLKEYIFNYTQDRSYFEHKLKAGSLCQVNDASQYVIMGIDDKLNILRFGQTCLSKRQMDQRYPNDGLRRAFWKKCAVCWVAGRYHERNVVDTICWGSKRTLGSVSYESIEPRFPARSKT
ncbi:unnamed protein product [Cladocopium goreaui]|uniref:Myb-like domain-containing protein n=1 Tax=Cladocopium goreaui TaxID=2562237 RepID=A0A9P1GQZ8_9DINO|nr:unnamed protein product [Cladocopium goreaui]